MISEKKDLVELVIRQHGASTSSSSGGGVGVDPPRPPGPPTSNNSGEAATTSTASTSSSTGPPSRRRVPEERKKSFPNSYVESTHRHDWLEKLESGQDNIDLNCEEDDDFVVVTPVQPMQERPPSGMICS